MSPAPLTMRAPVNEISIDVDQVIKQFLEIFDTIRLVAPDDEYHIVGRKYLASIVRPLVNARRPIGIVLPAFPAKSPNVTKKVLGALPGNSTLMHFAPAPSRCLG
jgi:pyoverdine/dityrosine biosynthesis protein Dit1